MSLLLLFKHSTATPVAEGWTTVEAPDTNWQRVEDALGDWTEFAPDVLPVVATVLAEGRRPATDINTRQFELGDITPVAGRPIVAIVAYFYAVNSQPEPDFDISGGGIANWTEEIRYVISNDGETAEVFTAWSGVDFEPTSGTLYADFPTINVTGFLEDMAWSVVELKNAEPHAVVQAVYGHPAVYASTYNATLAAAWHGFTSSQYQNNITLTEPDDFTVLTDLAVWTSGDRIMFESDFRNDNVPTTTYPDDPETGDPIPSTRYVQWTYHHPNLQAPLEVSGIVLEIGCHIPDNDDAALWNDPSQTNSIWQHVERPLATWN